MQQCRMGLCRSHRQDDIGYLPNSLKLVASISEFFKEKVGDTGKIINIDTDKFVMGATISHPDNRISLARIETHVHKSIGKEFMPSGSTGSKSIEGLDNDE